MAVHADYQRLFSDGKIGSLTIPNRILMTPMGTNLAQADGHCGERIQKYYEARAAGGVGMVIVGVGAIAWPAGACNPNQVAISGDVFLPGLKALVDGVHKHGSKAAIQLQHAGQVAVRDNAEGRAMLVPSVPKPKKGDILKSLTPDEFGAFIEPFTGEKSKIDYKVATQEDIDWLIECFADAADRAKRAGFDGVEIHAGHGYLISSFISPNSNQRTDEYGGPLENRTRLMVEVIQAVKARVGADFPVWCRIDSKEYRIEGGITLEDAVATAKIAEQAGADAVHVSAYADNMIGAAFTEAPLVNTPEGFVPFARAIRQGLNIPVIGVGRIEPKRADELIAAGDIDFVAMGRKLLADPDLPNKLRDGKVDSVRPCIYCYTCVSEIFLHHSVCCAVNPATGREFETDIRPAEQAKTVWVIGGGPGGMEAARVAALRGHKVTLFEKSDRLGGTVFFSSMVYPENGALIRYLANEIEQLPIDVKLQTTVDEAMIAAGKPDSVVVAVGAQRKAPPIAGVEASHVFDGDSLRSLFIGDANDGNAEAAKRKLSLWKRAVIGVGDAVGITGSAENTRKASHLWMPLGKQVVIIGGGLVGVELAEFLAERNRQVTILEEGDRFGVELALPRRWRLLEELDHLGVTRVGEANVTQINAKSVSYQNADGDTIDVACEHVIVAKGAQTNLALANQIRALDVEVHEVGDCMDIGYIKGAMWTGQAVALAL